MQTDAVVTAGTSSAPARPVWSIDARLMIRPASTCRELSGQTLESGVAVALRRPIVVAVALGCIASVLATGGVTLRLAIPAAVYWSYTPLVSMLALALTLARGRRKHAMSTVIDIYFAGYAPMVVVTLIGARMAILPQYEASIMLTTWGVAGLLIALSWSARIDYCFFRHFLGQTPLGATSRLILLRLMVWPVVFGIFSVPGMSFGAFGEELLGVARGLLGA